MDKLALSLIDVKNTASVFPGLTRTASKGIAALGAHTAPESLIAAAKGAGLSKFLGAWTPTAASTALGAGLGAAALVPLLLKLMSRPASQRFSGRALLKTLQRNPKKALWAMQALREQGMGRIPPEVWKRYAAKAGAKGMSPLSARLGGGIKPAGVIERHLPAAEERMRQLKAGIMRMGKTMRAIPPQLLPGASRR